MDQGSMVASGFARRPDRGRATGLSSHATPAASSTTTEGDVGDRGSVDWSGSPLVDGIEEPSLDAAKTDQDLPFVPVAPPIAGDPTTIYANPEKVVGLVYKEGAFGVFNVLEQSTTADDKYIVSLPKACLDCSVAQTTRLLDGSTAALTIGDGVVGVTWISNGVMSRVVGPSDTLTAASAVEIADSLSKAEALNANG